MDAGRFRFTVGKLDCTRILKSLFHICIPPDRGCNARRRHMGIDLPRFQMPITPMSSCSQNRTVPHAGIVFCVWLRRAASSWRAGQRPGGTGGPGPSSLAREASRGPRPIGLQRPLP